MTDSQPRGEIVIGGGNVALGKKKKKIAQKKTLQKLASTKIFLSYHC